MRDRSRPALRRATPGPDRAPAWVERLLAWYRAHCRSLPWRDQPTPYRVWVSEVMLQQTRVDTVLPYFERFLARFPDLEALARADPQAVLKAWEGLGYYSRARHLQAAARAVLGRCAGQVPATFAELCELPGVGPYTAAAIASIAFGEPVPVVDGNVLRVFARFRGSAEDVRRPAVRAALFARLSADIRLADNPGDFNQALMELGALLCRPRSPECPACPLAPECVARREGRTAELPVRSQRGPVPHHRIAVGVITRDDGRILIARRRDDQMLGGLWEFPGGKCRPRESLRQAAAREIAEETGLTVSVGRRLCTVEHAYSHFTITLTAFACDQPLGHAEAHSSAELKWVLPADLASYPFPTANRRVIEAILAVDPR